MKKISGYIFDTHDELGKGSYGYVYKGHQESTGKKCAIKVVQKKILSHDQYLKSAIIQQMQILQQVKSKNIVEVYDIMESTNNYYIIQELCDTDLDTYMRQNPQITEKKAIQFLKQMVNGFVSLVKQGIIHRDVKPANILLLNEQAKIGDFGFAKRNTTQKMKNVTFVGTPLYMSIQILKSQPYTSKCDVWAVGFIFYELLHNRTPWVAESPCELVQNIQKRPLIVNQKLNPKTVDFLKKSLAIYQKDRMSWDQVFDHPIFQKYFNKYRQNNKKIEDKLKVVLTNLRFKINAQNIDVQGLLQKLGFQTQKQQLNFNQFKQFMFFLNRYSTDQEIRFFFDRVDEDCSGTISVQEIEKVMKTHQINIQRTPKIRKADTKNYEESQNKQLDIQLASKAKKCFIRLYRVLTYKKISLRKTFDAYDKTRTGKLTFQFFKNMITRLDSSFTEEDSLALFEAIDVDHSDSIQYEQLNDYYCKVNGLTVTYNDFVNGSI